MKNNISTPDFSTELVSKAYDAFHPAVKEQLLGIRSLIFKLSDEDKDIGNIEETLKWGELSYLTQHPKSGTTIRFSPVDNQPDKFSILVHCQTTLVAEFKETYPDLEYGGNRSITFNAKEELPMDIIEHFLSAALTYHLRKKENIGA